jgi:Ca2+-binding RTX toxin-like protein/Mg-chelatase subunit ChlD
MMPSRRLVPFITALASCGIAAPTATAAIDGTVTNAAGIPIGGAGVEVRDGAGAFVASATSSSSTGGFTVSDVALAGHPAPYSLRTSYSDSCRPFAERTRTATTSGVGGSDTVTVSMDALPFCASSFVSSSLPPANGLADGPAGRIVLPKSGRAYIDLPLPSGAAGPTLRLDDGRVAGGPVGSSTRQFEVLAPGARYGGGLSVTYTSATGSERFRIADLIVDPSRTPATATGALDLVNVVDISGSMSSNDPSFRRKEAVSLVLDLSRNGDRVGAVGFDSSAATIFPLTRITGRSTVGRLRRLANARIVNRGGTDYDAGLEAAHAQLARAPERNRPKAAIFLTDGAHNGTYRNTHLKFAVNGSGRPWPICVVQLGRSFASGDVARLKRIARDTGGLYVSAPTNTRLTDLYFRCRGRTAGEVAAGSVRTSLRARQTRVFSQRIPRGLAELTFFAAWNRGTVDMAVRRPGGPTYTAARRPGSVSFRRGARYAFFRIKNPRAGKWFVLIRARNRVGAVSLRSSARRRGPIVRRGGPELRPTPPSTFVTCGDVKATIVGSDGNDVIVGTPGRDVIQAGAGNDRVSGLGGNDLICLGAGEADRASGGPGRDRIWGNQPHLGPAPADKNAGWRLPDGSNRIDGGPGNDVLLGAAGPDTFVAGPGRDFANGGPGNDLFIGGSGNDSFRGWTGDDRAFGGPGGDKLDGDEGADLLVGQSGMDRLGGHEGDDRLIGGDGRDLIFGAEGSDVLSGGAGNDLLRGDPPGNPRVGHGDDRISGGSGNDRITSGDGADTINAGLGRDDVRSGGGPDVIRTGNTFPPGETRASLRRGRDRADAGPGNDVIVGGNGPDYLVAGWGEDRVLGGPGDDRIIGGAFRCGELLPAKDRLFGQAGNDSIDGCADDDRIEGGPGNDALFGNGGGDTVAGGPGDDRIVGDRDGNLIAAGRDLLFGNGGNDRIRARYYADASLGGPGRDVIVFVGASAPLPAYPLDHPIRGKYIVNGGPGTADRCQGPKALIDKISGCEIGTTSK